MTQRVKFSKWRVGPRTVVAWFPDQEANPGYMVCYEHIGQHGEGTYPHPQMTAATPDEYAELLRELVSLGYDDLRIVRRVVRKAA